MFQPTEDGHLLACKYLAALYNRDIHNVTDILDRLEFTTSDPLSETNKLIFGLFQLRLKKWLLGSGHPVGTRNKSVESIIFDTEAGDPFVRSRLFLLAFSDSSQMPIDEDEKFMVCLFKGSK